MDASEEKSKSLHHSEITAEQCRMARAALSLGVRGLATAAGVSTNTITRLERGETLYERTLRSIRSALERAGVEFIAANGGGPGVRLAKRGQTAKHELREVGPEDEVRSGPEAIERPKRELDD